MAKVITGLVRFSYVSIFKRAKFEGQEGEGKYSISLIIDKDDKYTLDKIKRAVKEATEDGITSKWGGKKPNNLKLPLRDGDDDRPDDEAYAGHYFITANSNNKPGIVDADRDDIFDEEEVYSGCYGRASITFYPYSVNGNKGVAVGLQHVQKLKDGEPLGGVRTKAQDDFDDDWEPDWEDEF